MNDFPALDAHIERLRTLPQLARKAAPDVAESVHEVLDKQIAAGVDPQGKAWQPREDGERPLATAGKSLAVVAIGTKVYARLRGHVARHHLGRAKGGIERQILPTRITPALGKAITETLSEAFTEHMGGK